MKTLRIYSLKNFIHNIQQLIIKIMLYIIPLVLIYLITQSLYLLTISSSSLFPHPLPLVTTNFIPFSEFICVFVF